MTSNNTLKDIEVHVVDVPGGNLRHENNVTSIDIEMLVADLLGGNCRHENQDRLLVENFNK